MGVMFVVMLMFVWYCIWMSWYGCEMVLYMGEVGCVVVVGSWLLMGFVIVVGVVVLCEGFEVVLFLYGIVVGDLG